MTNTFTTADIAELIDKHRRQALTGEERERLQWWIDAHEDNRTFFEEITTRGAIEELAKAALQINRAAIRRKFKAKRRK
jgi:hypothetical protein